LLLKFLSSPSFLSIPLVVVGFLHVLGLCQCFC
jgi:hypothetical protein